MQVYKLQEFDDLEKLVVSIEKKPKPTAKQVLIRQIAISVERYDVNFCLGMEDSHTLPVVPGTTVAGEIVEIGLDVKNFKVGQYVVASRYLKTNAEYVVVNERALAVVPDDIKLTDAVSLAVTGQTAYQMIRNYLKPLPNQNILIQAGMSNVGKIAIQLAINAGANVYTTAGTKNMAILNELYKDVKVIDYTKENISDYNDVFDLILDTIGGKTLEESLTVLKSNGKLVSIVDEPNTNRTDIKATLEYQTSSGDDLAAILKMIQMGDLKLPKVNVVDMNIDNLKMGHKLVGSGHYDQKYVLTREYI